MITAPYRYYTSPPHTSYCCVWCRYTISAVYHESKVLGSHPREQFEAQFDIVTPLPTHSDNIKSVFCILHVRLKFIRMHIKHTCGECKKWLTLSACSHHTTPPFLSYYQVFTHSHMYIQPPSLPLCCYYRLLLAPPLSLPPRLVPDAEVMYVVSEILSEVPRPQHWQYGVLVNHMRLLEAVLQHCSIPRERYSETATLLHRIAVSIMCEECG